MGVRATGAHRRLSCDLMHDTLSPRPLTLRQMVTLDQLGAYDPAARVVGWIFFGPLVRLKSGDHINILPDGYPVRIPRVLLFPEESDKDG
jgi:hypothetical protein